MQLTDKAKNSATFLCKDKSDTEKYFHGAKDTAGIHRGGDDFTYVLWAFSVFFEFQHWSPRCHLLCIRPPYSSCPLEAGTIDAWHRGKRKEFVLEKKAFP